MTQRHARYLQNYPRKIALKRLKRRRSAKRAVTTKRVDTETMRRAIIDWRGSHPQAQPIRAGDPSFMGRIKRFFRKTPV